jgi:hypothetical protein
MKYLVKAIVPATVVRVFEVEAFNEGDALANYLRGEAFEVGSHTTTHDRDVVFEVDKK